VQLAQQSIAKNLGYLSPSTNASKSNELDNPAQHFEHPLTKQKMEALMALIEHMVVPRRRRRQHV
jgi:hypothetical protein